MEDFNFSRGTQHAPPSRCKRVKLLTARALCNLALTQTGQISCETKQCNAKGGRRTTFLAPVDAIGRYQSTPIQLTDLPCSRGVLAFGHLVPTEASPHYSPFPQIIDFWRQTCRERFDSQGDLIRFSTKPSRTACPYL